MTHPSAHVRALLAPLLEELALCRALVRTNANQHRRAPYFAAFRRLHALAAAVARACEGVTDAAVLAAAAEPPPAACPVRAAACAAADAARRSLPLCARVHSPQRGAGFAGLALVLAASAAVYVQSIERLRVALDAVRPRSILYCN